MKIYFINIENIINKTGKDNLRKKYGNYHHHFSRKFLKKILENIYEIKTEISDDNGRPYIKNSPLNFSISHSKNIIAIAFNDNDNSKIGLDIEYIKPRNYNKILNYYGINNPNITQDEFFQIWTTYEAEYKSGIKSKLYTIKYGNYMVSLSSENENYIKYYDIVIDDTDKNFTLNEIKIPEENHIKNSGIRLK